MEFLDPRGEWKGPPAPASAKRDYYTRTQSNFGEGKIIIPLSLRFMRVHAASVGAERSNFGPQFTVAGGKCTSGASSNYNLFFGKLAWILYLWLK